jgi:beta-glucosidase
MAKSTAFPCPIALTATWNPELAVKYAKSIGENAVPEMLLYCLAPE